jgi:hypothetical protein
MGIPCSGQVRPASLVKFDDPEPHDQTGPPWEFRLRGWQYQARQDTAMGGPSLSSRSLALAAAKHTGFHTSAANMTRWHALEWAICGVWRGRVARLWAALLFVSEGSRFQLEHRIEHQYH